MKKVYIAGPYSAGDVLSVFDNMRKGMEMAVRVRQAGFAPFCPWMDFMYPLINRSLPFTLENCYEYSMEWLKVSDYVLFIKGWKDSNGCLKEYNQAMKSGIPCFFSLDNLVKWDAADATDKYFIGRTPNGRQCYIKGE